jgi:glycosyltransferase involved in cell wall biosynthesis
VKPVQPDRPAQPGQPGQPAQPGGTLIIGERWFSDQPGGLNRYVADLQHALQAGGWPMSVMVLGPANAAPVIAVSSADEPVARRLLALRRAAGAIVPQPAVIDAHFALYAFPIVVAGPLRSTPLVVHFQGPWADETRAAGGPGWTVPVKRAIERAVYRRAERVVVLSEAFGTIAVERYGVHPARVQVIAPGVDLERFSPGHRPAARRRFAVADGDFLVVAARRLEPRMGLDTLLTAFGELQLARPEARLLIAGHGSAADDLELIRRRLPHPDRAELVGRLSDDDLVLLYRAADCSVVPSRTLEGFGLVVLESLACGTPAVVSDAGGLPDAVAGLCPGLVVAADRPGELAARLVAAADGDLPSRDDCRAHAQRFRWDDVARRHIELYTNVAADRAQQGTRRLKVVFVGHTALLSGGEIALVRLIAALDFDAHVILGEDGPLVARLRAAGATVEVLAMGVAGQTLRRDRVRPALASAGAAYAAAAYALRLARRLRQLRPDLVHTNTLKAHLYAGVAGRLAGVPVVWHVRDRIADDYLPHAAVRLVHTAAKWLPRAVITNSGSTRATLPHSTALRAVVVHDCVDMPAESEPRVGEQLQLGIVGRLSPWKGQHVFLEAFARACPGNERAIVVGAALFGEDDYARSLVELVDRLGIADRVEFRGHVDDVAAEYATLDVLVHASTIPEPFGQVVLEGMAAGLPVIAADAGGPTELITDGVNGLLTAPGDIAAVAAQLTRLLGDPALRLHLATAAREHAAQFSPQRTAAQVLGVYRDVMSERCAR